MQTLTGVGELRAWRRQQRDAGRRVAFVPTMGALHEGHLALIAAAKAAADTVVVSVFVNPAQFGPHEDFAGYPRNLQRDRALASGAGADLVFAPATDAMYPAGADTRVTPGDVAARWEGEVRPGHFEGVLTIVCKLFHLVEPDVACFGQKDYQQVAVIQQMIEDLAMPVRLELVPIQRDSDGLALSSRNIFLSPGEREQALALSKALFRAAAVFDAGERSAAEIEATMRAEFAGIPAVRLDYIAIVDPASLRSVDQAVPGTVVAVAARVGATRLIDNVILGSEHG